jgi:hypothetical protein
MSIANLLTAANATQLNAQTASPISSSKTVNVSIAETQSNIVNMLSTENVQNVSTAITL